MKTRVSPRPSSIKLQPRSIDLKASCNQKRENQGKNTTNKNKVGKNYLQAEQNEESHPCPGGAAKKSRDGREKTPARKRSTTSRKSSPTEKKLFLKDKERFLE